MEFESFISVKDRWCNEFSTSLTFCQQNLFGDIVVAWGNVNDSLEKLPVDSGRKKLTLQPKPSTVVKS